MNHKLQILKYELKERGILYVFKRIILFLLGPLNNLIWKSEFLLNLRYSVAPSLIYSIYPPNPKFFKVNSTDLMEKLKEFWYGNTPGYFDLDGEKISRKDIFTYGGPNSKFICSICQKCEWLSRVRQKNLFISHKCNQSKECEDLCQKQGNELWVHYHHNFDFGIGCRFDLPAPRGLFLRPNAKKDNILRVRADQGVLVGTRRLAYAFQRDIIERPVGIDWQKYDFLWVFIDIFGMKFPRPNIPVILYGHDFWEERTYFQWVIDWLKPDIFLTSYPAQWQENFKFPSQTKIAFYPLFPSMFFTRANLGEKKLDLLVIGATASPIYRERVILDEQIKKLNSKYKIEFSHWVGVLSSQWGGETEYMDYFSKQKVRYLNKWSEYLGSSKYVIFGRMKYPVLGWKYYETLGSGAIPIFPEVPDLKLLKVKPFEHYIPLSEVEGNNEKLSYFLDNYQKYKYIAENAVKWYKENSDKMLFNDFEDLIRGISNYKYPKRLV